MPDALSLLERRLLGVLVEKALTSSSPEPLTLNAIVTGANQKSNRDPVMNLEEPEADEGLEKLQRQGLVFKVTGGRVERWRHNLYEAWKVSKPELAILAELLLRGAQTAAEVRSRASRMEPLDHDSATSSTRRLVEAGYVQWLDPEDRRGARLTHGFHRAEEIARLKTGYSPPAAASEPAPVPRAAAVPPAVVPENDSRLQHALDAISRLQADVVALQAAVASLQESLGVTPLKSGDF